MASVLKLFVILLIFLYSSNPCKSSNDNSFKLDVDSPTFKDSLNLAMSILQNTTSTISNFQNLVKDFRLSNILSDCAKLLDSTQEVLDWSLTKFQNPHGTYACMYISYSFYLFIYINNYLFLLWCLFRL